MNIREIEGIKKQFESLRDGSSQELNANIDVVISALGSRDLKTALDKSIVCTKKDAKFSEVTRKIYYMSSSYRMQARTITATSVAIPEPQETLLSMQDVLHCKKVVDALQPRIEQLNGELQYKAAASDIYAQLNKCIQRIEQFKVYKNDLVHAFGDAFYQMSYNTASELKSLRTAVEYYMALSKNAQDACAQQEQHLKDYIEKAKLLEKTRQENIESEMRGISALRQKVNALNQQAIQGKAQQSIIYILAHKLEQQNQQIAALEARVAQSERLFNAQPYLDQCTQHFEVYAPIEEVQRPYYGVITKQHAKPQNAYNSQNIEHTKQHTIPALEGSLPYFAHVTAPTVSVQNDDLQYSSDAENVCTIEIKHE